MMFFKRRQPLDDYLEAIGPELRALPTPPPTGALRDRIVASREAGVRTVLPSVLQPRQSAARGVGAMAVVAALIVMLIPVSVRRTNAGSPRATDASLGFLGTLAYAQDLRGIPRPALPAAKLGTVTRVHPMALEFVRRVSSSGARGESESRISFQLTADTAAGIASWRIVSEDHDARAPQPHVQVETTFLARTDLKLIRRAIHVTPYSRFGRINVWQQFAGDSIVGRMNTDSPSIGEGRRIARVLPRTFAPYFTEATAHALLMNAPLTRDWQGSASLLGWAVRDDDVLVPIELRVEGEETISVPAGRFDCWRISIRFAGKQVDYWARKSDGLGVRVLDAHDSPNRTRELLLVRER
jgi:hypothetical protein